MIALRRSIAALSVLGVAVAISCSERESAHEPSTFPMPVEAVSHGLHTARAILPDRAGGAVVVEADVEGFAIAASLRGASGEHLLRATADGAEDFVFFASKPAVERLVWDVDVSAVAGLRLVSGVLEFVDAHGTPRLRVPPPFVVAEDGTRSPASLDVEGCAVDRDPRGPWGRPVTPPGSGRCAIAVAWRSARYPLLVDPAWVATGKLISKRQGPAVTLTNKQLLFAGSTTDPVTAELFDPATKTFSATGNLVHNRDNLALVALANGDALVTGGATALYPSPFVISTTSEVFHNGVFSDTPSQLVTLRHRASATLLDDGTVLVAGGYSGDDNIDAASELASAEIFDPADPVTSFKATGPMSVSHGAHLAVKLASGKVLVTGSLSNAAADVYDPATHSFTATGAASTQRAYAAGGLLADGRVLVAGGYIGGAFAYADDAEIYDPATNKFALVPQPLTVDRLFPFAIVLPGGGVMVGGGFNTTAIDLVDPVAGTIDAGLPPMLGLHSNAAAATIGTGQVLVAGGQDNTGLIDAAEILGLAAIGDACSADLDCASEACNDRCCASPCAGACTTCDAQGACKTVTSGQDPDSCIGTHECDASGACKLATGELCAASSVCASGFCADGVCCEAKCDGLCEACDEPLKPGKCLPVAGLPRQGHGTCAGAGTECGSRCDGDVTHTTECVFWGTSRFCDLGKWSCQDGAQTTFACDGMGSCVASDPSPCPGNFSCASATACSDHCAADGDCAPGYRCAMGACVPSGATCDPDGHTTHPAGDPNAVIDCAPYRCTPVGACTTSCKSAADCATPAVCNAQNHCESAPDTSSPSGCSVSKDGGQQGFLALLIGILMSMLLFARRLSRTCACLLRRSPSSR